MSLEINKKGGETIQDALYKKGLELESEIKRRAPVFTGNYRASWETNKLSNGDVVVGTNQKEKAQKLEYGLGSGNWPPTDQLRKWVRRKISLDDLDSATFLIGRKIFQEGVDQQPHIRPAIRHFQKKN